MATCDVCGRSENMPYHCRHCGGTFCGEHRLPESHDCPGLDDWNDPEGVFDSGFDDSVNNRGGQSSSWLSGLLDTGTGGPLGYFRGNMTFVFLGLMFVTFALQIMVFPFLGAPPGSQLWNAVFVISPQHPEYVWTWFTSIFAHGGFVHLLVNGIVIYFFGRIVENYIGSRDFTLLFLGSGALAGLGQIGIEMLQGGITGALGASGAALAIMGVLTVLKPDLRVYLYFFIPVPIWLLTIGYVVISVSGALGGPGIAGVANVAHLVGLLIGLAYGRRVKGRKRMPNQLQFGGGRGGGGMGGPGRGRGPF
ncbi:rhomboid family intramembrane serine protease [Halococcus thailandensis]|uniref:Rhomboid family protein n=1 Tax=Halococcus thailandensis JCM 13552 TaxID=1227457 RepID=M0N2K9_9EURY|nr:rhomboid family intramembrane serine protease [Halococcus thailandensis]EMA51758.1 Rhomboid family protein [Halococcus thailandensis JCM 13552]